MWKGIVGKPMTVAEFDQYVSGIFRTVGFSHFKWAQFCVVHNTAIPRLTAGIDASGLWSPGWHGVSGERRMKALESYYRDTQEWSGGPHAFIADDFIWPFTPLWLPGVHAPSWNNVAWGFEIVGDYSRERLQSTVLANVIGALSTVHRLRMIEPRTIRLHKEDPKTTHQGCPGPNVNKDDIIRAVQSSPIYTSDLSPQLFADVTAGGSSTAPATGRITGRRLLKRGMEGADVAELQALLGMTGLAHPGKYGPLTEENVRTYQLRHNLEPDGKVGDETWLSLRPTILGE